jgi:hypothetical protein
VLIVVRSLVEDESFNLKWTWIFKAVLSQYIINFFRMNTKVWASPKLNLLMMVACNPVGAELSLLLMARLAKFTVLDLMPA